MATRKKTTKPTRGGSSDRANPRHFDGSNNVTEQQHDDAMRVLRAEYYQGVRSIAHDLRDRIKDGEITSRDDLEEAAHQAIDGSYWVIYTHANFQVLMCSDHHDAYSEEFGEPALDRGEIHWAALAFSALQRDVQEQMSAEGIEINERELEERRPDRRLGQRRPAAPVRRRR